VNESSSSQRHYDVIIAGGSLAGATTAILLLREDSSLKILIVEKSTTFGRRVGEATVEISGFFLSRVLGLTQYLNENHLIKQGMRFWFYNERTQNLSDCAEIGGRYMARVPSYQVDRSTLDEEVLRRANKQGAEVIRPASTGKIDLVPGGEQTVEVKRGDIIEKYSARWVIDASGCAALLARQQGWIRPNKAHPTTAVWARWTGVTDWDGYELAQKYPAWSMACLGIRSTATNHFTGDGWWAWCIPLKGGDVSIGVVFDQRTVTFPENGTLGERLKTFLARHPVAREIMADAKPREGDVLWRKNLPYVSSTFAGDGFALVGDAAGFIDPFYSPGMDWLAFTTYSATQLILAQRMGKDLKPLLEKHNHDFGISYDRWFKAIYENKYDYLGEYDLMRLAFLLDVGLYYLGVASQPVKLGMKAFSMPMFSTKPSVPFFHFIRFYNKRFASIARARRQRNQRGRFNDNRRFLFPGYTFAPSNARHLLKGLFGWAIVELLEGWRSWFQSNTPKTTIKDPMAMPIASAAGEM